MLFKSLLFFALISGAPALRAQGSYLSAPSIMQEYYVEYDIPELGMRITTERPDSNTLIVGNKSHPIWARPCKGFCDVEGVSPQGIFVLSGFANGNFSTAVVMNPEDGSLMWTKDLASPIVFKTVYIGKEMLGQKAVFGFQSGDSYFIYNETGVLIREYKLSGKLTTQPTVYKNQIFWRFNTGSIVATDLEGSFQWKWELVPGRQRKISSRITELLFPVDGLLLFNFMVMNGEDEFDFSVRVLSTADGKVVDTFEAANSVVMDASQIYMQHSFKGTVAAYDRVSRVQNWVADNSNGGGGLAKLVLTSKYLLSADWVLNLFDIKSGALLESADPQDYISCPPVRNGGSFSSWFWDLNLGIEPNTIQGRVQKVQSTEGGNLCRYTLVYKILK